MDNLLIRPALPADALCLHVLATQVFVETYSVSGIREALAREVVSQFSLEACTRLLAKPGSRILLAEIEHHLVAFAEVRVGAGHGLVGDVPAAELNRLYVQRPFIRRSIGSALLREAERTAAKSGASTLWLTAWVGNTRALGFYASQGYRELGVTQHEFEGEQVENRLFAKAVRAET